MLPVPNPDVIYQPMGDGAVLFSVADEVYFGLNEVGAQLWELLPPVRATMDELCAALCKRYAEVPPGQIRADAIELLDALAAQGLVLPNDSAVRAPGGGECL